MEAETGPGSRLQPTRRWRAAWGELVVAVIDPGLCSGCAGCVVACPRGVLSLDVESWLPRLDPAARAAETGRCRYEEQGCTVCARACPRLGDWESEGDRAGLGRARDEEEVLGVWRAMWLASATDPGMVAAGQDGGVATAILAYALEHGMIDAVLVSYVAPGMHPRPGLARSRADLLAAAGSRYTYSANLLPCMGMPRPGPERLGLVSVGCQVSVPAVAQARGLRRMARRFALVVGLLCSRTFTDELFPGLVEPRLGAGRERITWMNIKGRLQVWSGSGRGAPPDLEVPLRDCAPFDRPGCRYCPDFSAGHADLSLGGIGRDADRTLVIVRSERAERLLADMERDGRITLLPPQEEDPAAVSLVRHMALRQRARWPGRGTAPAARPGGGAGGRR